MVTRCLLKGSLVEAVIACVKMLAVNDDARGNQQVGKWTKAERLEILAVHGFIFYVPG